jgi:hypothetical protein
VSVDQEAGPVRRHADVETSYEQEHLGVRAGSNIL